MNSAVHNQTQEQRRHSRSGRHRSSLSKRLERIRTSRRAKRNLVNLLVIIAAVVIAFVIGFFYFGPSFSSGE